MYSEEQNGSVPQNMSWHSQEHLLKILIDASGLEGEKMGRVHALAAMEFSARLESGRIGLLEKNLGILEKVYEQVELPYAELKLAEQQEQKYATQKRIILSMEKIIWEFYSKEAESLEDSELIRKLEHFVNLKNSTPSWEEVAAAKELMQRFVYEKLDGFEWEVSELFRQAYCVHRSRVPYAHLEVCEKADSREGILSRSEKLFGSAQAALRWINKGKRWDLYSVEDTMAPLSMGNSLYSEEVVLMTARIVAHHYALGRFTPANLNKAKKVLGHFPEEELKASDEEILCMRAHLLALFEIEEGDAHISRMQRIRGPKLSIEAQSLLERAKKRCVRANGHSGIGGQCALGKIKRPDEPLEKDKTNLIRLRRSSDR